MTPTAIFAIGVLTISLLGVFVWASVHEIRKGGRPAPEPSIAAPYVPSSPSEPMRILLATDGSPGSAGAVDAVAARVWPLGSHITVAHVVHTRIPVAGDPFLMVNAAHEVALQEARAEAPALVQRATTRLSSLPGVTVSTSILEGEPGETLVREAARLHAHLVVLGAQGHTGAGRFLLGSVSQAVAEHAPCSVQIARCPPPAPHPENPEP
jgi:nucleotide-binding universal stress UspA family protein